MELKTLSAPPRLSRTAAGAGKQRLLHGLRIAAGVTALLAGSALLGFGGGRTLHAAMAARDVSGTYALNTIAGKPVPATAVDTTVVDPWGRGATHLTIVLTGGKVTLTSLGTYHVDVSYAVTVNGRTAPAQHYEEAGTYAAHGSVVTFTSSMTDLATRGSLLDGSLTVPDDLLGREELKLRCLAGECLP